MDEIRDIQKNLRNEIDFHCLNFLDSDILLSTWLKAKPPTLNTHLQNEHIDAKIGLFLGQNMTNQKLSLFYTLLVTFSLLSQLKRTGM
jgi:hypothetical protein